MTYFEHIFGLIESTCLFLINTVKLTCIHHQSALWYSREKNSAQPISRSNRRYAATGIFFKSLEVPFANIYFSPTDDFEQDDTMKPNSPKFYGTTKYNLFHNWALLICWKLLHLFLLIMRCRHAHIKLYKKWRIISRRLPCTHKYYMCPIFNAM